MRALPGQEAVQQAACQALENLARDDDGMSDDGMRVKIAAAGGIVAIVAAMSAHKMSAGVQEQACGALKSISFNDDNEIKVAAAGGIEALATAM